MSPSESHLQHHVSLQDLLLFVLFFFPCGFVSLFNPRVACLVCSKLHALLDYGTTIFLETRKATLTPTLKRSHFKEKLVSRWGKFAFQIKRNCHEDLFVTKNSDSLVSGRASRRFSSCQKFTLLLLYGFQTTLWIVTLEAFADASHNKKPRIQSFFRGKIARLFEYSLK